MAARTLGPTPTNTPNSSTVTTVTYYLEATRTARILNSFALYVLGGTRTLSLYADGVLVGTRAMTTAGVQIITLTTPLTIPAGSVVALRVDGTTSFQYATKTAVANASLEPGLMETSAIQTQIVVDGTVPPVPADTADWWAPILSNPVKATKQETPGIVVNGSGGLLTPPPQKGRGWPLRVPLPTIPLAGQISLVGATAYGDFTMKAPNFELYNVSYSQPARLRIYRTAAGRTADTSRAISAPYPGGRDLVYEFNAFGTTLLDDTTPAIDYLAPGESKLYYNVEGGPVNINISWTAESA